MSTTSFIFVFLTKKTTPRGLAPTAAVAKARRKKTRFRNHNKEERRKGREFEHGRGHPGILSQLQASTPNFDSTRGMNTTEKDLEWSTQPEQNFPHRRQKEESSEGAKNNLGTSPANLQKSINRMRKPPDVGI